MYKLIFPKGAKPHTKSVGGARASGAPPPPPPPGSANEYQNSISHHALSVVRRCWYCRYLCTTLLATGLDTETYL